MADHTHEAKPGHGERQLRLALVLTLTFALIEAVGGWVSGSLALLGDAGHMLTDSSALAIAALAARFARRPPSVVHSYGLGRLEVVAAMLNALIMLAVVSAIAAEAVARLRTPQPVAGATVMLVAAIGLAVNLAVAAMLHRGEQTLNVRGALLHVLGDLLGSIAALLAGAVVYLSGWTPIDPLLALLVCTLILYSTLHLLRDALHVVMEGVPRELDLPEIGRAMAEVEGVISVHDLHIWTLSSGRTALSAHVLIEEMGRWETILGSLNRMLHERFDIGHVTLQPEPNVHVLRPWDHRPPGP